MLKFHKISYSSFWVMCTKHLYHRYTDRNRHFLKIVKSHLEHHKTCDSLKALNRYNFSNQRFLPFTRKKVVTLKITILSELKFIKLSVTHIWNIMSAITSDMDHFTFNLNRWLKSMKFTSKQTLSFLKDLIFLCWDVILQKFYSWEFS